MNPQISTLAPSSAPRLPLDSASWLIAYKACVVVIYSPWSQPCRPDQENRTGVWMSSYLYCNERLQLNAAFTSREEIVSNSFGTCNSWYLLVWQWLVWRGEFLRVNRERQISMLSFLQMVMPSCPLSTACLAVRFGGHLWMSKNIHTWISGNSIDMLICRRRWSYKVVFLTIGEWPTASLWRLSSRLFGLSFCVCKYR